MIILLIYYDASTECSNPNNIDEWSIKIIIIIIIIITWSISFYFLLTRIYMHFICYYVLILYYIIIIVICEIRRSNEHCLQYCVIILTFRFCLILPYAFVAHAKCSKGTRTDSHILICVARPFRSAVLHFNFRIIIIRVASLTSNLSRRSYIIIHYNL